MFESYFFIPADKKKFIGKIDCLNATNYIFDLEEAVYLGNINQSIDNLAYINIKDNYSVRIPVNYLDPAINKNVFLKLLNLGFGTFVLPKLKSYYDFCNLIAYFDLLNTRNVKYILIIETPKALLNIEKILSEKRELIDSILIGSHDYCNIVRCSHTPQNLFYLRHKLISICKAFEVPIIDFVSTETVKMQEFEVECIESFNMGFDGKAMLHPNQLKAFNSIKYYTDTEIEEALEVVKELNKLNMKKFSIIKVNGKIYEKPHLRRIFSIINYLKGKNNDT